jgi:phosphoglycerate-specific signal transduction histidine kinase
MELRTRLLLGYLYIVALLVITSGTSAVAFNRLDRMTAQILDQHMVSINATIDLLASLERQDSATLAALLRSEEAGVIMQGAESEFDEALATLTAAANDDVRGAVEQVQGEYERYVESRRSLLAEPSNNIERYQAEVAPKFDALRNLVLMLLTEIGDETELSSRESQMVAVRNSVWLGIVVTIAILSMALLARGLQGQVFARLSELKEVADLIAGGLRSRRVRVYGRDELSRIAMRLNEALDARDQLEAEMTGRLTQQRQVLLGMVSAFDGPVALVGLDGHVVASSLSEHDEEFVATCADKIRGNHPTGTEPEGGYIEFEVGGGGFAPAIRFRLLVAPGSRPVGWLAQPVRAAV